MYRVSWYSPHGVAGNKGSRDILDLQRAEKAVSYMQGEGFQVRLQEVLPEGVLREIEIPELLEDD